MWGESFIRNTDASYGIEEKIGILEEILPYSSDYDTLVDNYINKFQELLEKRELRSFCSVELERFIAATGFAYEKDINLEEIKESNATLGCTIEEIIKYMDKDPKSKVISERVYELIKPRSDEIKIRYGLSK